MTSRPSEAGSRVRPSEMSARASQRRFPGEPPLGPLREDPEDFGVTRMSSSPSMGRTPSSPSLGRMASSPSMGRKATVTHSNSVEYNEYDFESVSPQPINRTPSGMMGAKSSMRSSRAY